MRNRNSGYSGTGAFSTIRNALTRTGRLNGRGTFLALGIVAFMIAALAGIMLASRPGELTDGSRSGQTVPVIRAEPGPFRIEPEDRGGMDIPHRDSTIFQALDDSGAGETVVENLLDDDDYQEQGGEAANRFAGLNTTAGDEGGVRNLFEDDAGPEHEPELEPAPAPVKEEPEKDADASTKNETGKAAEVESAAGASASPGSFFVQLASLKTRESADSAWPGLQKKYGVLSGSGYRVQEADLGARGKFYRVQAGPFEKERAEEICSAIKSRSPGGCLVVGR